METKKCPSCETVKGLQGFSKRKASPDGLQSWCKECAKARGKKWQEDNPERSAAQHREWEVNNRQRIRENRYRWRERNPSYFKDWYRENPGKPGEYTRRSNERHPEKTAARNAFKKARARKEIEKPDACECCQRKCSGRGLHAHHDDYSKPLEVRWLCRECHDALHVALREAQTP